ncbi:hypothetical protein N9917_00605 [Deltaproteobacteria bacterium]|nr:hypothetical protein [Deltaproteobacteria bacterium]
MAKPEKNSPPAVAYGIKWHKLERPESWKPTAPGTELIGYYLGQSLRDGQYGQYNVALLTVPSGDGYSRPFTISGTTLISAIDAGQVKDGQLLRITFQGYGESARGHNYKKFDVYVGEGQLDEWVFALLFKRMETGDYPGEIEIPPGLCGLCEQPGHSMGDCPTEED